MRLAIITSLRVPIVIGTKQSGRSPHPVKAGFAMTALSVLLLLPLTALSQSSQDIYNYENSLKFSNYLLKTRQYQLATQELERVLFMDISNDSVKHVLIQAYRLGENYERGIARVDELYPNGTGMPHKLGIEYGKMLLLHGSYQLVDPFLENQAQLNDRDKFFFQLNTRLFQKQWKPAQLLFTQQPEAVQAALPGYAKLTGKGGDLRYKSRGLALCLSTVLPGAGKAYTKNWPDAILSLMTVGALAWQAYTGFNKNGLESAYGWTFGALAFGFYTGNLYGSFQSAKVYNQQLDDQLYDEVKGLFNSHY